MICEGVSVKKIKKDKSEMTPEELQQERARRKRRARWRKLDVIVNRIFGVFLATVIVFGIGALGFEYVLLKGPSPALSELFSMAMFETRRFIWAPNIFLTEEETDALKATRNNRFEGEMQLDLISVGQSTNQYDENGGYIDAYGLVDDDNDGIILEEVHGSGYTGYMLIVLDPMRVYVERGLGNFLGDIVKMYDAQGGINGGSYLDPNGGGDGSYPDGLTVINGEIVSHTNGNAFAGIDKDGILHVGYYDAESAIQLGIQYGVSFGPVLVYNGEPEYYPSGAGPRTAIGQRGDGAILMLVIDGRQVHSFGATYSDMTDVMLSYGAVNAMNLDGGSSTLMYFNGEYINSSSAANGVGRGLPDAFLIRREGSEP